MFTLRQSAPKLSLPARPAARLVWLHAGMGLHQAVRDDLIAALLTRPKTKLLLTGDTQNLPSATRSDTLIQTLPDDAEAPAFFDHFTPDSLLWSGALTHPKLMARLALADIPAGLFNVTATDLGFRRQRRQMAELLAGFAQVYCAEQGAFDLVQAMGTAAPNAVLTGPLYPMVALPSDDAPLRKTLSQRLAGRPVWAAFGASPANLPQLVAAQVHARRAAPGLIMLLVPGEGQKPTALEKSLATQGIPVADLKSGTIKTGALVFEPAQTALAARLAPAGVIADSLVAPGAQTSPLFAANLGVALIHGTHFGAFVDDFARLSDAKASLTLADGADIGPSLVALLRPDAAAGMATKAWTVLSAGADTLGSLCALAHEGAN